MIVVASVPRLIGGSMPVAATAAPCVPLSIVAADLFQRAVEGPSHRLAKRLPGSPPP